MTTDATPRLARLLGTAGSLRAQVIQGGVGIILLKVLSVALGLAVSILLARALEPRGYGVYAFALSAVTVLGVPVQFGLPTLLVREVARYQLQQQWSQLRGLMTWSTRVTLLLALLVVPAAAVIAAWHYRETGKLSGQLATFYWGLLLVPLTALSSLRGAALRGLRRVVQAQLPDMLIRPGLFALLVVCALAYGPSPYGAMALHAVAAGAAFGVGVLLLLRHLPTQVRQAPPAHCTSWLRSALPLAFLGGMEVVNGQTDLLMLGILATKADVGIYRVAVQGSTLVGFALAVANATLAPHFARLYAAGDQPKLQRLVTASARGIFAFALPTALVLLLFGPSILTFVFGPEYATGYPALAILCLGQLVNAACGSVAFLLNMSGHERVTARVVVVATVVNICSNAVLVPLYGAIGAALASTLALATWNLLLWRSVRRLLGIESTLIGTRRDSIE